MNLKSFTLTAIASTAIASTAMLSAAPAQALSLTGAIAVSGAATVRDYSGTIGQTKDLDFTSVDVKKATGSFAGINNGVSINSLPLTLTSQTTDVSTPGFKTFDRTFSFAGLTPFLNFGSRTIGGITSDLSFNLNASSNFGGQKILNGSSNPLLTIAAFGPIAGQFVFDGETAGSGFLSASRSGKVASDGSYQLTLTTAPKDVPTPALLPGLVGMGVAALRKRKSEEAVEAVEA